MLINITDSVVVEVDYEPGAYPLVTARIEFCGTKYQVTTYGTTLENAIKNLVQSTRDKLEMLEDFYRGDKIRQEKKP